MANNVKEKKVKAPRITVTELLATKMYKAIDDPITDLRIEMAKKALDGNDILDKRLTKLSENIWKEVAALIRATA